MVAKLQENEPKVSVIMLNHNGLTYLGDKLDKCISAVLKSDYQNFEFIFVDNNSTDGSVEYVQSKYLMDKRMLILRLDKNYGISGGYNKGALKSSKGSKYLVFLHNDVEIPKNWIKEMVSFMESSDESAVGAISSVYDVRRAGIYGHVCVEYPSMYVVDVPVQESIVEINHFSTGCGIIKRDIFLSMGGFDESIFSWYDEVEVAWKIKLIGGRIIFNPGVSAIHHCAHIHFKISGLYRNIEIAEKNRIKLCFTFLEMPSLFALSIYELYRLLITPIKFKGAEVYRTSVVIKTLIRILYPKFFNDIITRRKRFQAYRRASDKAFFKPWYITVERYSGKLPRKAKLARLLYLLFA